MFGGVFCECLSEIDFFLYFTFIKIMKICSIVFKVSKMYICMKQQVFYKIIIESFNVMHFLVAIGHYKS